MDITYSKGISPHGRRVYDTLQQRGTLTARKLATLLRVHPSAIYRLVRYLVSIGLVEEISGRPFYPPSQKTLSEVEGMTAKNFPLRRDFAPDEASGEGTPSGSSRGLHFRALSASEAKENYLAYQKERAENLFSGAPINTHIEPTENYHISFIQGRETIFARVAEDLKFARHEAHFIVLGLPIGVSPELMLEQKNAVERGVPIKIIVQEVSEKNKETISSWKKQGLTLRQGKPIGFHLLLIDNSISYLMYYDQEDKIKRYAVRIAHSAVNHELQKIFSRHWGKSKPI